MKLIQLLVAALLLLFAGAAYGDAVEIINLEDGDTVSAEEFTVVGKASGYPDGGELLIVLRICSFADLTCDTAYLDCEGMFITGKVFIQNQVMKRICPIKRGNITIVGKSSDYAVHDFLQITLSIWSPDAEEWQEVEIFVLTE